MKHTFTASTAPRSCVMISRREGDTISLAIDGVNIGHIELRHVPHAVRVRIACVFDSRVRITRSANKGSTE